ncbi:MAG TPA: hypothetical protein VMW30_00135 [Candidatus Paceibacterota bacterium]|nr:hypothetical protein [Candidatus Paceibacterota bacterium]
MQIFVGLQELLFPLYCHGCGVRGESLCVRCKDSFEIRDFLSSVGIIPTFSAVSYSSVARRILLASKEDGVRGADDLIVSALEHSLRYALRKTGKTPVLVPIPSSSQAIRRRGRDFLCEISQRVSALVGPPTQSLLQHNRKVRDQTLLDASARYKNLEGALALKKLPLRVQEVFLIDDLVTTGATLNEAVKTLEMGGFRVVGAVTALVSLPLR